MGFYIRKSIKLGPVRLNLSRSGLGASVGVKGARIGTGPRGRYVHMGRHGLYYRKSLGKPNSSQPVQPKQIFKQDELEEIDSAHVSELVDESSKELLEELNRVQSRVELLPIALIGSLLLFLYLIGAGAHPLLVTLFLIAAVALNLYCRNKDVMKGTVILNYEFEKEAQNEFDALKEGFQKLTECQGTWHIEASGDTDDWKHNGGASKLIRRKNTTLSYAKPRRVVCNIEVPSMKAGKQILYLFPDRILVYESKGVGAVSYGDLHIEREARRFIEDGSVPSDATIVDTTWQYVNKKGGPDRRFSNNREIPITLYEQMHLQSSTGLNELFQFSVPDIGMEFEQALNNLNEV